MAFSRRFPRDVKGSPYPVWEEVYISEEEERKLEQDARQENLKLMRECLKDAKTLAEVTGEGVIEVAIALFEKRASHSVYWKEESVKEKFDKAYAKKP